MDFLKIVDKFRNNEPLREGELGLLLEWLLSDEGKRRFQEEIESRWYAFESNRQLDYTELLGKLHQRIGESRQKQTASKPIRRYIRYAVEAAAVLLLVFGITFFTKRDVYVGGKVHQEQVEIYNPKGLRTVITLPDSSRVTLNADSRISYAYQLAGKDRAVKLEGEAFFEVEKDSLRPFIVTAGAAKMTVLGTSFNVRSYPESKYIETTLVEGSLRVSMGNEKSLLVPGEQVSINKKSKDLGVQSVNTQKITGWKEGKLYFQSVGFEEMAVTLERTFNTNIKIENRLLKEKKFTGKFENGENLEQILDILKLSVPFSEYYDKEKNLLLIY